ncbi:SAGA-associated factor 29, partial [Caerostris extrusa]
MAEKNVKLPPEMEFQADTLRNLLREIQETKTDLEELAAISKNEAELNAAGKKPKQSIVKNQLALYKKELNNTKQEIERIKNALKLISEMREDYFASISAATKESKQISKVLMSLKETAETLPLWIGEDEEEAPALCGAIQTGEDYVAK